MLAAIHSAVPAPRPMNEIDEDTIAHLQTIQAVISRMAANSFALKALAVTLTAGILAGALDQ